MWAPAHFLHLALLAVLPVKRVARLTGYKKKYFMLPEMHERYFYLADVISILYAFSFPRAFYIAILCQLCSLFSYAPYLWNQQIIPLSYLSDVELFLLVFVLVDLIRTLNTETGRRETVSTPGTAASGARMSGARR